MYARTCSCSCSCSCSQAHASRLTIAVLHHFFADAHFLLRPVLRCAQIGTLLYGKREDDGSFIAPVYNKEYVAETLLEASMDAVEQLTEDTGREVCTFMNPVRSHSSMVFTE